MSENNVSESSIDKNGDVIPADNQLNDVADTKDIDSDDDKLEYFDDEAMSMSSENTDKQLEFDVNINVGSLYDFQIYNSYCKSSSGIIGTCFGALGLILGCIYGYAIYAILGLIVILYVPVSLRMSCAKIVQTSEAYKKPLHYILDENGITVSQGEVSQSVAWEGALRAVSTKQSIIVYTGKRNASIFPRKQLGDKLPLLISVLARYMEPERVKIKY